MNETGTRVTAPRPPVATSEAMARLRALSRPRPTPREFIRLVSPFEFSALVLLLLLAVAIFLVYSYSILPGQLKTVQLRSQRTENEETLRELDAKLANPESTQGELQTVKGSLDTFRGTILKPRITGRLAIVETIQALTKKTGVQLASSVNFETKLPSDSSGRLGRNRTRRTDVADGSSFPSLGVKYSITGTYPQLRQFIAGFEQSSQFVVFDSVNLSVEPLDDERGSQRRATGGVGDVITLEIEMTAFFQPEGKAGRAVDIPATAAPTSPAAGQ